MSNCPFMGKSLVHERVLLIIDERCFGSVNKSFLVLPTDYHYRPHNCSKVGKYSTWLRISVCQSVNALQAEPLDL